MLLVFGCFGAKMPKPSAIITTVAGLMNDPDQTLYTNDAVLPYFNLALQELQELYELNDIPVTNETSALITIKAGIKRVGFDTIPALPSNLIEIKQLWESQSGLNQWVPMDKREFLPHYLEDHITTITMFGVWAWEGGRIQLIPATQPNDLKIDYTCSIFNLPILIKDINVNLPFTNIETYLEYKTAAICAMFIAENETRAMALDSSSGTALGRALGIPIKGMQSVVTRRRPFRASFKRRQRGVMM
jgi:hypothetical protein